MAQITPIGWMQNVGATNSAQVMRMSDSFSAKGSSLLGSSYMAGRGGVLRRGSGLNLELAQQGGGTMSVVMEPGMCYVPGTENLAQMGYMVGWDASQVVGPFAAAHATLNRTDVVYTKIRDSFYSGASLDAQVLIATGTAGGAEGSLAGIANALMLGKVTVRAGATSIITTDINNNETRYFTSPGGVTPIRIGAEGTEPGVYGLDLSMYGAMLRWWSSSAALWRTLGVYSVADLNTIWNPQAGDTHFLNTTKMWNRYTGSGWEEVIYNTPRARLRQTVSQGLTTSVNTGITFDVEDKDTLNGHSTVSLTDRYVCQRAGSYQVSGAVSFPPNATGFRAVRIWKNGAIINGNTVSHTSVSASANHVVSSRVVTVDLLVGDYVQLVAIQNSGGTLNTVVTADDQATMEVLLVGT
jgi:hypothetical protein